MSRSTHKTMIEGNTIATMLRYNETLWFMDTLRTKVFRVY